MEKLTYVFDLVQFSLVPNGTNNTARVVFLGELHKLSRLNLLAKELNKKVKITLELVDNDE